MKDSLETNAKLFRALGEPVRLKILSLLSCHELCACQILSHLNITQPTLSYHMKTFLDLGLVNSRKEGTQVYYQLQPQGLQEGTFWLERILGPKDECECFEIKNCEKIIDHKGAHYERKTGH